MGPAVDTHEYNFVVQNHRPIAAANIRERFVLDSIIRCGKHRFLLEHRCHVGVPLTNVVLPSSQMTIDKAQ